MVTDHAYDLLIDKAIGVIESENLNHKMEHWDQKTDQVRYVLTRTTREPLLPHLHFAIACMNHDMKNQLDPLTQQRLIECATSGNVAWIKFVFLQSACCSPTLIDRMRHTCKHMDLNEWVAFLRREFLFYLCGTRVPSDQPNPRLIHRDYVELVRHITRVTVEW